MFDLSLLLTLKKKQLHHGDMRVKANDNVKSYIYGNGNTYPNCSHLKDICSRIVYDLNIDFRMGQGQM